MGSGIVEALVRARQRGVEVQLIADRTTPCERGSGIEPLARAGVPIWIDRGVRIAHIKAMVIDRTVVLTGSMNWTASAGRNSEDLNLNKLGGGRRRLYGSLAASPRGLCAFHAPRRLVPQPRRGRAQIRSAGAMKSERDRRADGQPGAQSPSRERSGPPAAPRRPRTASPGKLSDVLGLGGNLARNSWLQWMYAADLETRDRTARMGLLALAGQRRLQHRTALRPTIGSCLRRKDDDADG
jgi:PLD-like domain